MAYISSLEFLPGIEEDSISISDDKNVKVFLAYFDLHNLQIWNLTNNNFGVMFVLLLPPLKSDNIKASKDVVVAAAAAVWD